MEKVGGNSLNAISSHVRKNQAGSSSYPSSQAERGKETDNKELIKSDRLDAALKFLNENKTKLINHDTMNHPDIINFNRGKAGRKSRDKIINEGIEWMINSPVPTLEKLKKVDSYKPSLQCSESPPEYSEGLPQYSESESSSSSPMTTPIGSEKVK